jgi:phage terminase large subunit-like protein
LKRKTKKKWLIEPIDQLAIDQGCYVDEAIGQHSIDFLQGFCHQSKGRWAGKLLELMDWQKLFIMRLHGWRMPDGTRRFRTAYLEVAKKNGKSTMVSGLACEGILDPNDGAPEIYLNAVDREQAAIVFDECTRMVQASPELSERLQILKTNGRIIDPIGNGKIQKNSADAPSKDGVNASKTIFDEIHRFKNRDLWDVFRYAGISREEPLRVVITTAGEEEDGPWFEQRDYSEKVNAAVIPDIRHLGVVYRALPDDDVDDPETWRKANPSMGITMTAADFKADLDSARSNPADFANFKRLRLNIVARGEGKFIELHDWDACAESEGLSYGDSVYMGFDLSDRDDLSAMVVATGSLIDGITIACRFWLPEDNIVDLEHRHQVPYREWAREGWITLTPGNTIDRKVIRREILERIEISNIRKDGVPRFTPVKLLFDGYNAHDIAEDLLNDDGLPVEYVRQGFLSLNDPTKTLRELIMSRKLHHAGHPILRWNASNAAIDTDAAGNIKLTKKKSRKKIDGMAALVNCIYGFTQFGDLDASSVYERPGMLAL